jgi:CheY-like chemotaxis protein
MPETMPLIFVVDDEPLLIELATAMLEPSGYQIKSFMSAELALEAFGSNPPFPDLILTDYAMHNLTGLDLIRECRKINPKQKILLVSGTVDEEIYANSRHKPNGFLAKPYQSKQLIGLVESILKS